MNILVQRSGQQFGPYPEQLARQYLTTGQLFPQDLAKDATATGAGWIALDKLLNIQAPPNTNSSNIIQNIAGKTLQDLKSFDLRLVLPWREISSLRWVQDRKLIYLALIGLAPATVIAITGGAFLGYWAIAFYFSALWAVFFYYLFKTPQVKSQLCFLCFFFTGIISISVLLVVQQIPPWTLLYSMTESQNLLLRAFGMFFGVGINEELCKAAIIFWLVRRPGSILIPQTVVFYAMLSGLGFGIYEGVAYQQTVNREQGIDTAYFLNIARLTSLPFLHAMWTGIAGYFISFSALVPAKKYGLWVLAILIPASLHASYNTFGWSILGLGTGLLSVILLMTYLSNCNQMQKQLGP